MPACMFLHARNPKHVDSDKISLIVLKKWKDDIITPIKIIKTSLTTIQAPGMWKHANISDLLKERTKKASMQLSPNKSHSNSREINFKRSDCQKS